MRKIWIIARKDIREAFRTRSTYLYIIFLVVFSIIYISNYSTVISRLVAENPVRSILIQQSQEILNSMAAALPMMFSIWLCTIFATYAVVVEKAKRNLESLMAAPVSVNQIWIGKSLAVVLPSLAVGLIVAIVVYVAVNLVLIIPHTGRFIVPGPVALVTAFIIVPLLIFAVVSLVLYLQLVISNPRVANFAFIGIFFLLFFGVNALTQLGMGIDFSYIYGGVVVVCGIAAYFLSRSLTREKVLLSSK